ncbi:MULTISPECIES: cyclase family protein [Bradyrhizobium]|uniref:hypothetical protein n=1 Tax=Bradyrhizobium pachyrhizi TaxID=280333 RepID=UPI00048841C5
MRYTRLHCGQNRACVRSVKKKAPVVRIIDLSRGLYHRTPSYPGHPPIMHGMWKNHEEVLAESRNTYRLASIFISMPDYGGTHIDVARQ